MNPAPARGPQEAIAASGAQAAHQRRMRAAWLDYLRQTTEVGDAAYDEAESNAWEQLQRRLRRNDELLALALHNVAF